MQMGIFYILIYDVSFMFIVNSILASSLIFCFSFGFILIDIGFKNKENLNEDKNILLRYMGIILVMISFAVLLSIMIDF